MVVDGQRARVIVEPLETEVDREAAVLSFARGREPAILDSGGPVTEWARYTLLASDPAARVVIRPRAGECPFAALAGQMAPFPTAAPGGDAWCQGGADLTGLPIHCGWIGCIRYEAGRAMARLAARKPPGASPVPLARFCFYDSACIYDRRRGHWYVAAVEWPRTVRIRRPSVQARLSLLRNRLARAGQAAPSAAHAESRATARASISYRAYRKKVRRILEHIAAGDVYQVNLTNRFTIRTNHSPAELYLRLRRQTPAPHGAFLSWGDRAILSASPELFLTLRDGHVATRPIKGTRPRGGDTLADRALRRELCESAKDRAELNMIVDLLRNDLGRVCSFGSVRVRSAGDIEAHPNVFHRVATVEGELAPGRTWPDLLRAAFPGGSVTGAPKIRAMQIIEDLEPVPRGVYCGAIGHLGLDGSLSLNLAIRTMVQRGHAVHFHAGGGIVADSDPDEEYEEMLAKASGMMQTLQCALVKHGATAAHSSFGIHHAASPAVELTLA